MRVLVKVCKLMCLLAVDMHYSIHVMAVFITETLMIRESRLFSSLLCYIGNGGFL